MMRKKSIIHSLLIITLVLGMVGMTGCHKKDMDSTAKQQAQTEDEKEPTIQWQGKNWQYNKNISNYLFIGVDTREQSDTRVGRSDAGQAGCIVPVVAEPQERRSDDDLHSTRYHDGGRKF